MFNTLFNQWKVRFDNEVINHFTADDAKMRALICFSFSCHGYKSYAHISCIHYPNGSQATDNRSQSTDLHWKCAALVMWRLALELLSAGAGLRHVWNKVIPSLSFVLVTKDVYSMRNWLGSKTHSGASCWPHCDIGFIHFRRHCIWRTVIQMNLTNPVIFQLHMQQLLFPPEVDHLIVVVVE